jgi:hypothetical protein
MKLRGFIQRPFGTLFENPNIAKLVIDELGGINLKELFIQPSVVVPGDDCESHCVNGIFYVAFDQNGKRFSNAFVAQGAIARSLVDPFGKKRVHTAISELKKHFEAKGILVYEEAVIYK